MPATTTEFSIGDRVRVTDNYMFSEFWSEPGTISETPGASEFYMVEIVQDGSTFPSLMLFRHDELEAA